MNKDWRQSSAARLFAILFAIIFLWIAGVSLMVVMLNVSIGFASNEADFRSNFLAMTTQNEYELLYNYLLMSSYSAEGAEYDDVPVNYGLSENLHTYETHFNSENTNFRFAVTDTEGELFLTNDPLYGMEQALLASNVYPESIPISTSDYRVQKTLDDPVHNFAEFIGQDPKDMLDHPEDYRLWYFSDTQVDNALHKGLDTVTEYTQILGLRPFPSKEAANAFNFQSAFPDYENLSWHFYGDPAYRTVDAVIHWNGAEYVIMESDGTDCYTGVNDNSGVLVVLTGDTTTEHSHLLLSDYYSCKANGINITASDETLEEKLVSPLSITIRATQTDDLTYFIRTYLPENLPVNDSIRTNFAVFQFLFKRTEVLVIILFTATVLAVISCITMCSTAGYSERYFGAHASRVHRMPFELYWALPIGALVGSMITFSGLMQISTPYRTLALFSVGMMLCIAAFLVLLIYSIAVRLKTDTFWSSFGIVRVVRYLFSLMRGHLAFSVSVTCWLTALLALNAAAIRLRDMQMVLIPCAAVADLLTLTAILYSIYAYFELHKHAKHMETGDFSAVTHKIPLTADFRRFDATLTDMTSRVEEIVAKQTKAEHLRTELITNVSHDLKTPLTSIVNYVDLLSREQMPNPAAEEYLDVLRRQAARLKKLTVDLVDASKASTGNMTVELAPTDLQVLIGQLGGEYEEQLEKRQLSFVMNVPEEPVMVLADGRQIWRVFDNLLGNACKYALAGTRVYLDLKSDGKLAEITIKNVSAHPLNVSPDELMERFVRGDTSRHTEGSGLGLAIARDLTALQHGLLELSTDGDLFKVTLSFPVYTPPAEPAPEPETEKTESAAEA
ncbi:MAG TPA: hypothetical protein DDX71_07060 [Ruminococcus sp.]|nr:hypothetical protein [Ruminococcus sp.]